MMDPKHTDVGTLLSEMDAAARRSRRRAALYTLGLLLAGGLWIAYSIREVSSLATQASELRTETARLRTGADALQKDIVRLDELRYAKLREWGWLEETIAKVEQSAKANDARQQIAAETGTPADLAQRRAITIEYFLKDVDKDRVLAALGGLGFTALRQSPALGTTPTNTVWFGRNVAIADVKLVAYTLMRAGIQIRDIRPFLVSEGREALIQVGGRPLAIDKAVWSVERIAAVTEFPR